jgi:hypothetical protein
VWFHRSCAVATNVSGVARRDRGDVQTSWPPAQLQ